MSIGAKIKKLREENNWSQTELAHLLEISQTTLCNIESDKSKKIDFLLMVKVGQVFGVVIEFFIK